MKQKIKNSASFYLWLGLAWVLFWVVPWGNLPTIQEGSLLAFGTEMFRLFIALLLFIVPGIALYLLLKPHGEIPGGTLGVLPISLTFSITIIAVIGLIGRLFGLSFSVVKILFFVVGLIEIILMRFYLPNSIRETIANSTLSEIRNPALLLALIFSFLMSFHDYLFIVDDFSYLAYITNWQHADQLGFTNIVHEVNVIEPSRFWLTMYPMGQALLADLSGLPGILLLGNYLELFLVPIAVITLYWFTRYLGLSRQEAGFATLIQIILYAWMLGNDWPVGMWFYQCMAEDKVIAAFVLSPVFFVFGMNLILGKSKKYWVLFFLSTLGLTLTHPIILFYSAIILLMMGTIALAQKQISWRLTIQLGIAVIAFLLPYLGIRIFDSYAQSNIPYDALQANETFQIEQQTLVINDIFYAMNPGVLQFMELNVGQTGWQTIYSIFRFTPIIISIAAALIASFKLKKGAIYWYVISCVILILFAAIPYTGWILGQLVSALMLVRTSWYMPLGIGSIFIYRFIREKYNFRRVKLLPSGKISKNTLGLAVCFIFISPILFISALPRIPAYFQILDHYKQLARVGEYIDSHTTSQVTAFGLEYLDTQFLPGVSSNARVISFRENNVNPHYVFKSEVEYNTRNNEIDQLRTTDGTVPESVRCPILIKYQMKYVLARSDRSTQFFKSIENCTVTGHKVFTTETFELIELDH